MSFWVNLKNVMVSAPSERKLSPSYKKCQTPDVFANKTCCESHYCFL